MNSFPKNLVIEACEELIKEIEAERRKERLRVTTGKRTWIGRALTPDEAYERLTPLEKLMIEAQYGGQEIKARRILAVATHCQGDSINLSAKEFAVLETWYGTATI